MRTRLVLSVLLVAHVSACGFVHRHTIGLFSGQDETAPFESGAPELDAKAAPEQLASAQPTTLESKVTKGVEVIWAIPSEPVEGYIVRFGTSRESLTQEKKIEVAKLERFEDPQFGYVYRTTLDEAPQQNLFVSLVAFNGSKLSAPSPIFEVKSR